MAPLDLLKLYMYCESSSYPVSSVLSIKSITFPDCTLTVDSDGDGPNLCRVKK